MINVKDKYLVVPSEILAEGDYYSGRGTFKEGSKICSSLTGLVSIRNKKISVIPLKSKYIPKRGDVAIGEIDDVRFSMWGVNINSPYSGILPASEVFGREKNDLNKVFKVGDVLFLRVVSVDEVKKVRLGLKGRGMGKFRGGILVNIAPTKVPRLIGKKGSMINMIKDKTDCKIVVGQNGVVWVKGEKEMELITRDIINLIEAEAHTSGLTNRIKEKLYLLIDGELPEDFNLNNPDDVKDNDFEEELEKPELQEFNEGLEHFEDSFNNEFNSSENESKDLRAKNDIDNKNEEFKSYGANLDSFKSVDVEPVSDLDGLNSINTENIQLKSISIENSGLTKPNNEIKAPNFLKGKNLKIQNKSSDNRISTIEYITNSSIIIDSVKPKTKEELELIKEKLKSLKKKE
ncbi:polyribonucleotide nucleotidyltransferase [Methanobrevibacter filiformis]|uniref:Exosome complex component Rrp4 n=1 Tax=Methanobrevibacter filiformis TaxID=55758 RepID=A0A166AZS3_9EURY|nr:polyribonucleotide nucleotidyltransferase [Methanobrevibacter filiformis]